MNIVSTIPVFRNTTTNLKPIEFDYFKLDFKHANYNIINFKLHEINWNDELSALSILQATEKFYSIVSSIIDKEVPKKHKIIQLL